MSSSALRLLVVALLLCLVAACSSSPEPAPTPTSTATAPAATATATPTIAPTATATATATPAPIALWVDSAAPDLVSEPVLSRGGLVRATEADGADAVLALSAEATSLEVVLVPVVPFPTIPDEVAWEEVLRFWGGDETALSYLGDGAAAPTLMLSEAVKALLVAALGEPAQSAPIALVEQDELVDLAWDSRPGAWSIVPFDQLEPRWKALRIDGVNALLKGLAEQEWPLRFYFGVTGERAADVVVPSVSNRDEVRLSVLVMTGVTAMVRGTAARMEQNGLLYPVEYVAEVLQSADIAHVSNEIPFAESCPPPDMNQESLVFCSDPRYIETLRHLGTDVVELTGNHFQDWGSEATEFTVRMYNQEGWVHYGGGIDLEDARSTKFHARNGNSFSFIGCNPVGPEYAWAAEGYPGAAPCDFDYMHAELERVSAVVDVPIATWQYWEFYHYEPTPQQQEEFRGMVDAGARIVSGSQAHHPQAIEFYNGGFIHYGLGNFLFDQMWSLGTRQECIDRHIVYDGRHLSTEVLTYMLEDYAQPRPMTAEERTELLTSLFAASGW